jgi:hypothetical protein
VPAVAHAAHRAADAVATVGDRPGVGHLERGHRRALGIGEDDRAMQRVVEHQPRRDLVGNLQGDRDRPRRPVGEPAPAAQRVQVGTTEKAGQGRIGAGEQQIKIC